MEEILLIPTIYNEWYQWSNIYILGILCSKSQNASQIGWFLKGPGSQMNLFSTCMRLYETFPTYYIPKDERIQPTFQTYPWMIAFLQYKELCVRWKPSVAPVFSFNLLHPNGIDPWHRQWLRVGVPWSWSLFLGRWDRPISAWETRWSHPYSITFGRPTNSCAMAICKHIFNLKLGYL